MPDADFAPALSPAHAFDALRQPVRKLQGRLPHAHHTPHGCVYQGEGQPVIVFPRQGTGPECTAALRRVLADAGFRAHDWGHGTDEGPRAMGLNRWLRKLEDCVIDVFEVTQAPVTLLGWGLSGIYARELAKRANPLVRQVITLGTPFNTAADPHRQCPVMAMLDSGPERMPLAVRQRLRQRPPVPCTSLYSKDDGVVRWEQCVETETEHSENVEVPGARHDELAVHPKAIEVITHRLAQAEDSWRPFGPAGPSLS
ncbi:MULTISPECIES: alpha/beta hydrolase [Ramlibacter]|uniref:Alpha/beta hydrolase n=1 Tax=Ramlibacter pinisoli TaxID=2682844 RepID=A0A6N8IPB1_9BURK|nr:MULTISPECIES: alpha/beta hydrolase [Ramlibacter]MBA2963172.1 alpha/beta hydrolase [Ramlibacter sp. CGMCC 1.13660]MVQ28140.1 alpha/beta hydrolase [Ramlibacter pinisoli]